MKKLAYLLALISTPFIFLTGCKEDSTPPKITITGDAHVISARGAAYMDAGATATDDKDESVYVLSDYSAVNPKHPDIDIAGDYLITYTAQDRAGNISTAIRRVSVTYTVWDLNHYYNVTDICLNDSNLNANYQTSVVVDTTQPFRAFFTGMTNGFFSGLTYMDAVGTTITIPKQKPDGILSPFEIEGSGTVSDSANIVYHMVINYTIRDTITSAVQTRHAVFHSL